MTLRMTNKDYKEIILDRLNKTKINKIYVYNVFCISRLVSFLWIPTCKNVAWKLKFHFPEYAKIFYFGLIGAFFLRLSYQQRLDFFKINNENFICSHKLWNKIFLNLFFFLFLVCYFYAKILILLRSHFAF